MVALVVLGVLVLPCIAVHAFNNAIAMGTLAGWDWQIPLVVIGAVALSVALVLPFARERAPDPSLTNRSLTNGRHHERRSRP